MKHNKTFHQLFPDIPKSEDLIHGRLTVLKDIMKDFMKKKTQVDMLALLFSPSIHLCPAKGSALPWSAVHH